MIIKQNWHTAIVTGLLNSSKGDLILDQAGDLCTRIRHDWAGDGKEIPWHHQKPGTKLAIIYSAGWRLTSAGAEYILQNSGFLRKDEKRLRAIADGRITVDEIADGINAYEDWRAHHPFWQADAGFIEDIIRSVPRVAR